ncbi:N-acetyltransferase [Geodermatophilus sp. DF01-2]|nr:N-acetyltransferase [Geodermatophilus sp. DF01_2]
MVQPILPPGFAVPPPLRDERFHLEPLTPAHNARDHAAWTTSIDHIRATPGFAGRAWPGIAASLEENESSLRRHEEDAAARRGFACAVLDAASGEYLGCVYFYPPRSAEFDVDARSWVRADWARLDALLHDIVRAWLGRCWPWRSPDYAVR